MSDALELPVHVFLNRNSTRNVFYVVVLCVFAVCGGLAFSPEWRAFVAHAYLQSLFWFSAFFSYLIFIVMFPRPAEIVIDKKWVTVNPIGFLGRVARPSVKYALDNFDYLGLYIVRLPKGGNVRRFFFMNKKEWKKVFFDPPEEIFVETSFFGGLPSETKMIEYANKLGAAINMKVVENA